MLYDLVNNIFNWILLLFMVNVIICEKTLTIISVLSKNSSINSIFYFDTHLNSTYLNSNIINVYKQDRMTFENITYINKFSLHNTDITYVTNDFFAFSKNLEYLSLSHNKLVKIYPYVNSKLLYIDLSFNLMVSNNIQVLDFFPNLLIMNLANNNLTYTSLLRTNMLKVLNLRNNCISSLIINAQNNTSLKSLILDNNPLLNIDIGDLIKNKIIMLSVSNISKIQALLKILNGQPNLRFIDLSYNLIPYNFLTHESFNNMTKLMNLNLRGIKLYDTGFDNSNLINKNALLSIISLHINKIINLLSSLQGLYMREIPLETRLKWIDLSEIDDLNSFDICIISNLHIINKAFPFEIRQDIKKFKINIKKFGNWARGMALNGTIFALSDNLDLKNSKFFNLINLLNIPKRKHKNNNLLHGIKYKFKNISFKFKKAMDSDPGNTIIGHEIFDTKICKPSLEKGLNPNIFSNPKIPNDKHHGALNLKPIKNFQNFLNGYFILRNINIVKNEDFVSKISTSASQEKLFIKMKSGQDILLKCPLPGINNVKRYWDFFKSNPFAFRYLQERPIRNIDPIWLKNQPIEIINESPLDAPLTLYDIPVVSQIAKKYYPLKEPFSQYYHSQDNDLSEANDSQIYNNPYKNKYKELENFKILADNYVFDKAHDDESLLQDQINEKKSSEITFTFWHKDDKNLPILKALVQKFYKISPINISMAGYLDVSYMKSDKYKTKNGKNLLIKSLQRSQTGLYSCYHLEMHLDFQNLQPKLPEQLKNLKIAIKSMNIVKGADFIVFLGDDFFIQIWSNSVFLALTSAIAFLVLSVAVVYSIKFIKMCRCIKEKTANRKFTEIVRELQQNTYKEVENLRMYYMNQLNKIKDNCLNTLDGVGQPYTAYASHFNQHHNIDRPSTTIIDKDANFDLHASQQEAESNNLCLKSGLINGVSAQQNDIVTTTYLFTIPPSLDFYSLKLIGDLEDVDINDEENKEEDKWYYSQINRLREYTAYQIEKLMESYSNQVEKLNTFTWSQLDRIRAQYKISAKNIGDMMEMMNLDNCRNYQSKTSSEVQAPGDTLIYNMKLYDDAAYKNGSVLHGIKPLLENEKINDCNNHYHGSNILGNQNAYKRNENILQIHPTTAAFMDEQIKLHEEDKPCCSNQVETQSLRECQFDSKSCKNVQKSPIKKLLAFSHQKKRKKKKKRSFRDSFASMINHSGGRSYNFNLTPDPLIQHSRFVIKSIREKATNQLASAYSFNSRLYNQYFNTASHQNIGIGNTEKTTTSSEIKDCYLTPNQTSMSTFSNTE